MTLYDSQDVAEVTSCCGHNIPEPREVTAVRVTVGDGDYTSIEVTYDAAPYLVTAHWVKVLVP